jgi:cytosine/adenosine deaminase-related metal-dependent hydrolase
VEAAVFHEVLGWDPARAEELLRTARERLAACAPPRGVHVRQGAHGPHSVSPALLAGLAAGGGIGSIHLAESPAEVEFLRTGGGPWADFLARRVGPVPFTPPGLSPVRYLDGLGVLRPGMLAVHCVHVDEDDAQILAARGVTAVLCPVSNRWLGNGIAPLELLRRAGVRLAVGSDSAASGGGIDLWPDLRLLRRTWPDLPPSALVEMATRGGAVALGLRGLGAVGVGVRARLAYAPASAPVGDPEAWLLDQERPPCVVDLG